MACNCMPAISMSSLNNDEESLTLLHLFSGSIFFRYSAIANKHPAMVAGNKSVINSENGEKLRLTSFKLLTKSTSLYPCTFSHYTVQGSTAIQWIPHEKKTCKVRIILYIVPQIVQTVITWQTIHTHHTRWPSSAQGECVG